MTMNLETKRGEIGVSSTFQYEFENTTYEITNKNGAWDHNVTNNNEFRDIYFKLSELYINGQFGFEESVGLQIGIFSSKVLGVGFNIGASQMFTASIPFSLYVHGILDTHPCLHVTPEIYASLYCYARLFGKNLGRHEAKATLSSTLYEMPILPKFDGLKVDMTDDRKKVTSSVDYQGKSILRNEESGLSLFKDEEEKPLQCTQTVNGTNNIDFSIDSEDIGQYYVAPYVKIKGEYFYGEKCLVDEFTIVGTWFIEGGHLDSNGNIVWDGGENYWVLKADGTLEYLCEDFTLDDTGLYRFDTNDMTIRYIYDSDGGNIDDATVYPIISYNNKEIIFKHEDLYGRLLRIKY